MTTRQTRWAVPALVILLVACVPRDALALIGWIEALSGPGPFWGVQVPFDRLVCVVRTAGGELTSGDVFGGPGDADLACTTDGAGDPMRIRAYLSVEVSQAWSGANDRFPAVTFTGVRPIIFFRLHRIIDAGVGVAFNRFSGTGFGFSRRSVPVRARITAPWLSPGSKWRGIQLAVQADYFRGEFTSADFLASPGFQEDNEVVKSVFLSVDVLRLVSGRWRSY